MDGWWEDIEREIVQCLECYGELSPSEIGKHVGVSEASIVSLLGVLAVGGAVRIARVAPGREDASTTGRPVSHAGGCR